MRLRCLDVSASLGCRYRGDNFSAAFARDVIVPAEHENGSLRHLSVSNFHGGAHLAALAREVGPLLRARRRADKDYDSDDEEDDDANN